MGGGVRFWALRRGVGFWALRGGGGQSTSSNLSAHVSYISTEDSHLHLLRLRLPEYERHPDPRVVRDPLPPRPPYHATPVKVGRAGEHGHDQPGNDFIT